MSILRAIPSILAVLILVVAPLPFGSTHAWTVSALEVALFVLLGLNLVCQGAAGVFSRLSSLALLAGALAAYLGFQLVPLPAAVLGVLNPTQAALYRNLLGPTQRWLPLSLDAHASSLALLRLAAYASVFVIVATATSPRKGYLFYWGLLAAGALTAVVAWLHLLLGWNASLLGLFPAEQTAPASDRLSWPFVNGNHLAMAMNLVWPLALGAAISPSAFAAPGAERSPPVIRIAGAALFALLVATLVGSKSRGGMASAAAAPLAMSLAWPLGNRGSVGVRAAAAVLAALILTAGAAWIVSDVVHRPAPGTELIALDRGDASLLIRWVAVRQSFGILRDFPWFGSGLGTWSEVFPMYQRYPLLAVGFSHAHNDYVQWLEETGVAGLGLLGALAALYFARVLGPLPREAAKRRAALLGALAAVALHSAVDFGLRIPANALLFAAVLGLLWREISARDGAAGEAAESGLSRRVLAAVAGAAGLALLVRLGTLEWRDARMLEAAATIQPGDSGEWTVLERAAWRAAFGGQPDFRRALAAVEAAPTVSTAHRTLAFSCRSAAMKEREHRRAIRCAPAFGWLRAEFARLLLQVGRRKEALEAVEQAVYADPNLWPADLVGYLDTRSGKHELFAAALRGLRRRASEAPELSALLKSREAQFRD
jgi:O-antigen ligase